MFEKELKDKDTIRNVARKLESEGFDVWENDPYYQGIGFKLICDKVFLNVSMIVNETTENVFTITMHEKTSNILDIFKDKELKNQRTTNASEVYDIIKEMLQ